MRVHSLVNFFTPPPPRGISPVWRRLRGLLLCGLLFAAAGPALTVWAQPAEDPGARAEEEGEEGSGGAASRLALEEIVVTGTASDERTKFDSSVAITTMNAEDIRTLNPLSTADLLSAVPGLWVESSSGESNANVYARGIPQDGGYFYLNLQEDGSPVFPVSSLSFFGADMLIRLDESVERMEAVRGGTAPIFASSAPGGIVNFVTKQGTQEPEGLIKLTLGDFGLFRNDFFYSGPLSEDWLFSFGGFYRSSDGIRDPQFRADRGGQLRFSLTRLLEDGELSIFGRKLNDRNLFPTPLPLQNPRNPEGVPGFDAGTGILHSNDLRRVSLPHAADVGLDGADLADGIRSELDTLGLRLALDLDTWTSLENIFRYTEADITFNSIFTGTAAQRGSDYADGRGNIVYAGSGAAFDHDNLVIDAGLWLVAKQLQSFSNDLRINFQTQSNDFTFGFYYADYSVADQWSLGNNFLMEAKNNAQRLRLAGVTSPEGLTRTSTFHLDASHQGTSTVLYASDEWNLSEDLRFDFGLRWQRDTIDSSISEGATVDFDGDPTTPWDNETAQTGNSYRTVDRDFDDLAWSVGFNYNFTYNQGIFGHWTDSFRISNFDDLRDGRDVVESITQVELGYKLSTDYLAIFATLFRSEFDNVYFNDVLADGSMARRTAGTENIGIELEGVWTPLESLEVVAGMTLQQPEYTSFTIRTADNPDTANDETATSSFTGNTVKRLPELLFRSTITYRFGERARIYGSFSHVGKRYSDDENVVELPAYNKFDIGFIYNHRESLSFQVQVNNLTDEVGLTEGNPRVTGPTGVYYNARPIFGRSLRASVTCNF